VTPVGNWTPPACWYQPMYTPAAMKASSETVWGEASPSEEWKNGQRDRYVNGKPYTNFNLDKAGKGYFWSGYTPASNYGKPDADSCKDEPFWVDKGQPAPPGHKNAVTPEILAELAYAQILIPQGQARTNPVAAQTVNLPTWVWLDATTFHPVSVTAYLPDYGISATTTARPVSMHIDPGTQDATLHPASGDCPIDAHGNIGTPYAKGDTGDPPCGVTYLRSTQTTGPYQLKATVTWKISWIDTGQPTPVALPDGTFGTPQDVDVREIQTVNR
jgi:enoyl reductase